MHELSLASSILDLAMQHTPPGTSLRVVRLRAGPMRGIEPQAMQWAWQACIEGTDARDSRIELELLPWRLRCSHCGSEFSAPDVFDAVCPCGGRGAHPVGGDELQVMSIEVDEKVVT